MFVYDSSLVGVSLLYVFQMRNKCEQIHSRTPVAADVSTFIQELKCGRVCVCAPNPLINLLYGWSSVWMTGGRAHVYSKHCHCSTSGELKINSRAHRCYSSLTKNIK